MTSKISEAYSPIPQRRRSNGQVNAEFGDKRTVFPFKILKVNLVIETKEYAYCISTFEFSIDDGLANSKLYFDLLL